MRAAGATCLDQTDEQEPGFLTAREQDIYMCKTLTYSPGSTGTAKAITALCLLSVFNLTAQRTQFAVDLEGTPVRQVSS